MVGFLYSRVHLLLAGLLLVSLLAVIGCGSGGKPGTVQGKVKVDGTLANAGSVIFTTSTGATAFGTIQADGTYKAIGVPVGATQVTVTGPPPVPVVGDPRLKPPSKDSPSPGGSVDKPVPIPAKYGKADSSGLTYTVKGGSNTYDIDLTAK